jgi:homoserine dehydrogenase
MAAKPVNVGIIGFGNVGGGAFRVLRDGAAKIAMTAGGPVRVTRVADIDWKRPRPVRVPDRMRTTDAREIVRDPAIQIVVETIGGVRPLPLVMEALRAGKNIVTSNKELIAKHGAEILDEAARRGLDVMFEGAVGGGIPVIRPLKVCLAANRIYRIMGIVNGTTNYILSKMAQGTRDFEEVLAEAQALGYAEPDPRSDIDGYDAAYKLAILASIAFNSRVRMRDIYREGIRGVRAVDMAYARDLGYVIKLLAIGADTPAGLELRVHPVMLPGTHPLAAVNDVFNAIFVEASAADQVMLFGRGAGALPTGSAVAGDVIDIARNIRHGATGRVPCTCYERKPAKSMGEVEAKYYLRMQVADRPGVLAQIAAVFGAEQVSIASVVQKASGGNRAEIVWITHTAREARVRRSLERIARLAAVQRISSRIRVHEV